MALPNTDITPGSPPLLWSNIYDAFRLINENFTSLDLATGGTAVDLETLNTSVSPADSNTYQLGSSTRQWKSVYTSEYADALGSDQNGVWLGTAHIKGIGSTVELPYGSTIGGERIKDPTRVFFKEVQVDNSLSIVAIEGTNSFGLNSGNGVSLSVDSSSETITFNNEGVTSIVPNTGISVSSASGDVTVTNTGVTSLTNTTALPSGRTQGVGINVSASTGGIAVTNTGVLSIEAGSAALIVSTDAATGIVTITNAAPAGNAFRYAVVNGLTSSPIEANSVNGILNFVAGQGITLSQSTVTDTITFSVNPEFDLTGSIFADNSTKLVDGVEGKIVGPVYTSMLRTSEYSIYLGADAGSNSSVNYAVGIGFQAQQTSPQGYTVAVGSYAGNSNQGQSAVAIGSNAGETDQGSAAVAIGNYAGQTSQHDYSLILNASGSVLNSDGTSRFYVDPIRNATGANGVVQYNSTTKEVSYSSALGSVSGTFTGNIFTTLIDSADSSAITVTPKTIFSSDVDVGNELRVRGSLMISVTQLQSIAAASADFAAFKTAIAALVA